MDKVRRRRDRNNKVKGQRIPLELEEKPLGLMILVLRIYDSNDGSGDDSIDVSCVDMLLVDKKKRSFRLLIRKMDPFLKARFYGELKIQCAQLYRNLPK